MKVTHTFTKDISREGNAHFLLVNKRGSYLALGNPNTTAYRGLHYLYPKNDSWEYYKLIDNIYLEKEPTELLSHLCMTERKSGQTAEAFILLDHGLVYKIKNYKGKLYIDLDFRDMYDFDDKGRIYRITRQKDIVIVEYKKYSDNTMKGLQKKFFMIIKGLQEHQIINQWNLTTYDYDKRRADRNNFWIYRALQATITKNTEILITYGETKAKALKEMKHLEERKNHLVRLEQTQIRHLKKDTSEITNPKIQTAYASATHSLKSLTHSFCSGEKELLGILAGLPWFYQFWTRDELISLKAFMIADKHDIAKKILQKHLNNMMDDGRIPNRTPWANLGSADGIGWLFRRFHDFLLTLQKNNKLDNYFSRQELEEARGKLETAIQNIQQNHVHEGLVWNNPKETWMDTDYGNDKRDGKRIEIQALYLSMLAFSNYLDRILKRQQQYLILEQQTAIKVKQEFFKDGNLWDGDNDSTIRPNIFLAHYLYPGILAQNEWKQAFINALPKLWLDWGGLASIQKDHPLYCGAFAGENNKSYHRGDSWFYINNLAAISLYRLDKEFFKKEIAKIIEASTDEILFHGFAGHHSEISSAQQLESFGCWCQAWSDAAYIEMIKEIFL